MPFTRPAGTSRFINRSAAKLGLPSAWLDEEYDAIYTVINGLTLVANSSEWTQYPAAVTYVSGTDFTVAGDQTAEFYAKRRVRPANAGVYVYSKVQSSSYNGGTGLTTVVLADSVLLATLNQVFYSITHSNKAINAIHAEMIPSTAYGALAATDVQAALEELESEKLQSVDVFGNWVVSGLLGVAPGVSLTMTTPSGVAHQTGKRVVSAGFTHTYTASKDTYDDINSAGVITHVEVNNGAGVPAVTADSQRLQKVVTNGSQITSVTDLRKIYPAMDVIAEKTDAAGVTIDGLLLKDGKIPWSGLPAFRGCYAFNSNAFFAVPTGAGGAAFQMNLEIYDTDAIHDNAVSNTRFTIPAGVSYVKFQYSVWWRTSPSAVTRIESYLQKSGSGVFYGRHKGPITASVDHMYAVHTGIIPVSPGDWFELFLIHDSGVSVNVNGTQNTTYVTMEIIA